MRSPNHFTSAQVCRQILQSRGQTLIPIGPVEDLPSAAARLHVERGRLGRTVVVMVPRVNVEREHELIAELLSDVCWCGNSKRTRQTFCYRCYGKLPPDQKKALYHRIGDGYGEAYTAARQFLDDQSRL